MEKIDLEENQTTEPSAEGKVIEGSLTEDVSEEVAQCQTPDLETTEYIA